jgi:hypothetical protein
MIDIQYGKLFTLEILHRWFNSRLCNDFSIVPSQATIPVLNGYRIVTKQYANDLYAGIQLGSPAMTGSPPGPHPFIPPAADMQLTFFGQLRNNLFFNYTNLPSKYPPGKIYYFTNRNNNTASSKIPSDKTAVNRNFLSCLLAYDNTATYSPGSLVTAGDGTVFLNISTSTGVAPAAGAHWMAVDTTDHGQYVSEADALTWLPSLSTWSFPAPQSSVVITVHGYNAATSDYTGLILSTTVSLPSPLPFFTLDLTSLPAGKYHLSIKGNAQPTADDLWIYINDELKSTNTFCVIDLFNDDGIPNAYQLLDVSGSLLSPLYSIYFPNRYSIWKYVLASGANGVITDKNGVFGFPSSAASTIFSLSPIPLSEAPQNFSLTIGAASPVTHLSCPSPERLVTYQPNPPAGDIYACSEIYLNH